MKDKEQYIIVSHRYGFAENSETTYITNGWYFVKDNIWSQANWKYYDGGSVPEN